MAPGSGTGDSGPLRVAVDVSSLSGASAYRGIGRYLSSLLDALAEHTDLEVTRVDAADARSTDADVFWSPAQSPPRRCAVPWVQTLHDLTPLVFPDKVFRKEARHWRRQRKVLARAAAVVCPSVSSARQVVGLLGLDESKVHVVVHGIAPEFHPVEVAPADPPYLLAVGAWGPHKGFDEAMDVVGRLAELGYPHVLRIVGPQDDWMRRQLEKSRGASRRPDRVVIEGYVEDVVATYNAAAVMLCPSHAEGFGFPVAEAMACGTPVVAYDNTSLPEVVGDAGLLVPTGDVEAMTAAVRTILDEPAQRGRLRDAGLARVLHWTWERAAAEMDSIFHAAARPTAGDDTT